MNNTKYGFGRKDNMARIYKVFTYIVDSNGEYDNCGELIRDIADSIRTSRIGYLDVSGSDIYAHKDDLIINLMGCPAAEFEKYFEYKLYFVEE